MNVNNCVLLVMYAVAASDGKPGGGVTRVVPKLTGLTLEEVEEKIKNFDEVLEFIQTLPQEAILSIITTAEFIMHADGIIDPREEKIVNSIKALLK